MPRSRIGFRLSEEQKARWEDHVEESRYDDTLSDFLKRAAEEQIDRDSVPEGSPAQQSEAPAQSPAGGEVLDRIQDLQNEMQDLEGQVSQALDAVHGQEGVNPDVPPEVHSALPLGEENAVTAAELAERSSMGFREVEVRYALENMVRNMGDVHKTPTGMPGHDEEVRWYRSE